MWSNHVKILIYFFDQLLENLVLCEQVETLHCEPILLEPQDLLPY